MESAIMPNPTRAKLPLFDRTGWRRMAFGAFAESIGERAEPKDAQEEIYVGLEHLDSQCLHIRRWGKGSDVIGGNLRFRKGDIIFGKRRPDQRKAIDGCRGTWRESETDPGPRVWVSEWIQVSGSRGFEIKAAECSMAGRK
jgi:hypothetical protein